MPGVEAREFVECFVEGEQVNNHVPGLLRAWPHNGDSLGAFAAALGSLAAAGVLDQDLSHGPGSDREKVGAVGPRYLGRTHQSQVGLVYKGGRLEGMVGAFAPHIVTGKSTQIVVDKWQQCVDCFR